MSNYCCNIEMLIDEQFGIMICVVCGSCLNNIYVSEIVTEQQQLITKSIYKPVNHLIHKLKEVMGLIITDDDDWKKYFINEQIADIKDIRKILKKHNVSYLNKYSYYFYEQLTEQKVFKISHHQRNEIIKKFIKYNILFRENKMKINRKNHLNFHFILSKLMMSCNIECNDKLFIPQLKQTLINHENVWQYLAHL